ncbi:diguanylate cyclase (GGDEF) domain-containing protein [Paenibacillus tianmuensis]|uniref:Diguanylate cyclase (GGDEF) domain-containing protein n=1 Tax=Paenibacillus tianmuensis TaxID=624147 RepID=A0A1G4T9S3_9BACL|nr:GGDEF domain-containing protein [Paenibacillus tianmuensis]SCW77309.1 diguanylate cyclase (GGDEF) domain-containing protein [Paenibacillus tianmuensis]
MKGFYAKNQTYLFYQLLLLLLTPLACYFAFGFPPVSWNKALLLAAVLLIGIAGTVFGLVAGLGLSLAVMFVFGSILLWKAFVSSAIFLSAEEIVIWMAAILAAPVVTGMLHKRVTTMAAENQEMKEKFDHLVIIDEATGFDNYKRFLFEMEDEFKRSRRTGAPFSLLLIQVKYFEQFQKLYGAKETLHLLQSLSGTLWSQTRMSDRKFRIADDTFAVILSNTEEENADIVIGKIGGLFKTHVLANQKQTVTLNVAFGVSSYNEGLGDAKELVQNASYELEQYIP